MFSSITEGQNQFINTNTANTIPANPAFPTINTFAGTGENITNKLDQIWTLVNTEINDFLQLPDWEVKTRLAITGDWSANEAQDFFSHVSPENTNLEILPANDMPGIAGGYDAITGKIYLSEDLVKYSDTAKIAEVLIEELGHKADDILNPGQDSPGDEGEILAKLVTNQGSIPSDWQVLKEENDHKFIQVGDVWIGVEASESIKQEWLKQLGSSSIYNNYNIGLDKQDNIYISKSTSNYSYKQSQLVEKYNPQGQKIWSYVVNVKGITDMQVDQDGSIYILGGVLTNSEDPSSGVNTWIAKYNTQGQQQWVQEIDKGLYDGAIDLELDQQGNIYVTNEDGYLSTWLVKYNNQGQQQWIKAVKDEGSFSNDYYVHSDITLDQNDNIYIGGTVYPYETKKAFIAKYNTNGQQQQFKLIDSQVKYQTSYKIAVDQQNNIYVAGRDAGASIISKYNPQIKQEWSKTNPFTVSMFLDVDANSYLTGYTNSRNWITKYDSQGQQQWEKELESIPNDNFGSDLIVDQKGNVFWVGQDGNKNILIKFSQETSVPITPNISIQDVNITEGNSGRKNANFKVTLDQASDKPVTVQYTTVDDTAKAGQDFTKKTGKLTFKPGVKTQTINVPIIGDTVFEPDEKFTVRLSQASNGKITKANGIGTILNDDQKVVVLPNISIQDVSITEGNSGQKNANFKVTLDKVSNQTVTVQYATVDDTAKAGQDFVKKTGKVTFKPGVKTQTIAVPIIGDKLLEPKEQFSVKLSKPSNGKITKVTGIGTITNDDSGDVTPTIPLEDKEPDNNNISNKLPTFSNVSHEPIRVMGNVGSLIGSQRDVNDYYRLVLDQPENDVYILLDGLQQDANIQILGQDGSTQLFSSEKTGKDPDSIPAMLSAGTYYVRVYPKSTNATPYRLSINI